MLLHADILKTIVLYCASNSLYWPKFCTTASKLCQVPGHSTYGRSLMVIPYRQHLFESSQAYRSNILSVPSLQAWNSVETVQDLHLSSSGVCVCCLGPLLGWGHTVSGTNTKICTKNVLQRLVVSVRRLTPSCMITSTQRMSQTSKTLPLIQTSTWSDWLPSRSCAH